MGDEVPGRVQYEMLGNVASVTLDRPHRRNALNSLLLEGLLTSLVRAEADPAVRAVLLSGTDVFSAGADVEELADRSTYRDHIGRLFAEAAIAIRTSRLPVVAAVEGYALGGALMIALSCDLVVLSESAFIALPEIEVGLVGGVATVREIAGRLVAARLCLLGERMPAAEAARLGLGILAPSGSAVAAGLEKARRIAEFDEHAAGAIKDLLADGAVIEAIWAERDANVELMASRQPLSGGDSSPIGEEEADSSA